MSEQLLIPKRKRGRSSVTENERLALFVHRADLDRQPAVLAATVDEVFRSVEIAFRQPVAILEEIAPATGRDLEIQSRVDFQQVVAERGNVGVVAENLERLDDPDLETDAKAWVDTLFTAHERCLGGAGLLH